MKTIKIRLTVLFLFLAFACLAQEVDITKGDLSILKGESSINVEMTYEKMAVGDFSKEADYIKKRMEDENKKDPPNGDHWAAEWDAQKKNYFGEKFTLGLTKTYDVKIDKSAKYTLIVNTKALEPGYQVGISKKNAGVDLSITLIETGKPEKKLAVLYVERKAETMWRGAAFDAKSRIGDAYYVDGQAVGKFFKKNIK
ncbi:MAG: hypothetical protein JNM14_15840 [Ferruginibacter sp.]|nr:hypothetical protein [Ferruginibacter sp.]